MWRSAIRAVLATMIASAPVLAQTGSITGRVVAAEGGQPIPHVQVTVAGTGTGTLTRDDGRYTVAVRPGTYVVRASRIGFARDSVLGVTVVSAGNSVVNFSLRAAAVVVSEIVVTGYGTQQARDRTGSIETVSSREFNTGRITSPEQLISGKVPGVQVVDQNEPGAGMSIRIRGGTSVTSSNEPLFVVDGVPLPTGDGGLQPNGGTTAGRNPLNFLNPNDIESITVLKDASSTAIYGSRGANGVVLITTKNGASQTGMTYTGSVSTSRVNGGESLLDVAAFRAAVTKYAPESVASLGNATTDWRAAVQRSGLGQEHNLAFAGNKQDMNYRMSFGYLNQDGVILGTTTRRLSTAIAYNDRLWDKLDLTANVKGSRNDDQFTPGGVIGNSTVFNPTQPFVNTNGTYYQYGNPLGPDNPIAELAQIYDRGTTYRSVGNLQGKYKLPFLENLTATMSLGYDVTKGDHTTFLPSTEQSQVENGTGGYFGRTSPTQTHGVLDAYANYSRAMPSMSSTVEFTGGYSYEQNKGDYPSFFAQGLSSDLLGPNGVPSAKVEQNTLYIDESKLVSFFGRMNYALKDKYLLTLSVRRDGSSKFGPENQWGVFPSAAVAWRVSEEDFMRRFPAISDLKLRYSYGVNGNQAFNNYRAFSDYVIGNPQAQVQFGNQFVTTIRPSAADPGIRWEQTTSNNFGVDYGFHDNRVTGTIDAYTKKTKDLIFNVPVAAGTNLSNFVTTNIGSLENKGLELGLNIRMFDGGKSRGFTWDAGFNAATNTNKLLQINSVGGGTDQILTGGIAGGVGSSIEVLQPGYAVNSFFVYEHKRNPDGSPVYADVNGDGTINEQDLYVDQNGDGVINQSDRRPFHNPAPKWIIGHTSNMTMGNADLGFTIRSYRGNYVYNNVASTRGNYAALKGGSPINLDASVTKNGFVQPQYFSDVYIEDASFIRMDNLTAGYKLRGLKAMNFMRVFGTIQNVFTTTKYTGVDPTAGVNGIDNNIYPRSRTFVAGANIAF